MAAIQLNFNLRTSANVKTVHLLGSWDNYNGQLPLSKDSSKTGGWKGTFRFQGATLKQGQRYWYYYIIDGYHVSHDPARQHTVEPTTQRKLNILDIPASSAPVAEVRAPSSRQTRRVSAEVAKGRALSPSKIVSPTPVKPGQTRNVINYAPTVDQLTSRFSATTIHEQEYSDSDSDVGSDVPSLTSSRSSASSSPSSVSSNSSCCTCERYGITRSGNRVKLDCGGSRCGSDEDCSSDSDHDTYRLRATRRQGMVVG